MKKRILSIIITALLIGSCSDSINDLLDELNLTVPICVAFDSTAIAPDGRGWKNAYPSIEAALASPRALDGAEIWVKAGTYNVGTTTTINSTSPSVSIYGGFNGTEERLSQRNINVNVTTIQVTGNIPAFSITGFLGNILIDGFTFKKSGTYGTGLGVTNSSSITVRNCTFEALNSGIVNGGAISIDSATNVVIENLMFINNSATSGGGAIYINQTLTAPTNVYIKGSEFIGNSTTSGTYSYGGAIYCCRGKATIDACKFYNNSAAYGLGGAIYTDDYPDVDAVLSISNSCFYNNQATADGVAGPPDAYGKGGAIYIEKAPSEQNHSFINLTFFLNSAESYGGGIYCLSGNHTIINSVFYQNTSGAGSTSANIYDFSGVVTLKNCFYNDGVTNVFADSTCINDFIIPFVSDVYGSSNFLYPASNIIDKGTVDITGYTLSAIDLAGNPRVVGSAVDMGAYEAQ